jgi:citronellyl-CoA dehydrogenase
MRFTDEHRELQNTVRRFMETEVNPHVDAWEDAEAFPARELFKKLGDLGVLGVTKPVEFGGLGLDYSYALALAEALAYARCGSVPLAIGVQTDMATPALARFGSDALREEFLRPSIAGDLIGCIGVSEPNAGSDVAAIRTRARRDGGDYVIDGSKMWITNALSADWICLLVNTGDGPVHRNKSLIVVPMKTPGVSIAKKIRKVGMQSSDTGLIYFDNVRVPQRWRIGEEGQGFVYQMLQFQEERLWGAANGVQAMTNCIDQTIEYARERRVFGAAVLDNQWVHFKLAELKTEVEALRALVYRACELHLDGQDVTELASMAKLKGGRLARLVPDTCMQFWGGMGYTWENPVSRYWRDGRLASIGAGADEVMLSIICKAMGIHPQRRNP